MVNEASCGLIQFIRKRKAAQHTYDNGVNEALEKVAGYINENKAFLGIGYCM